MVVFGRREVTMLFNEEVDDSCLNAEVVTCPVRSEIIFDVVVLSCVSLFVSFSASERL